MKKQVFLWMILALAFISCQNNRTKKEEKQNNPMEEKLNKYETFKLTADVSQLSENNQEILKIFFDIAEIMDELFWEQAWGHKNDLLNSIQDEDAKKFAKINYGPWDRLDDNNPFLEDYGSKPKGANFYPKDMTKEEFEALNDPNKKSLYTIIVRDENNGNLKTLWYHEAYKEKIDRAAELLRKAAGLAEDKGLKNYLTLRADALQTDDYQKSDFAWMDMKTSPIDFVVGPIENYEDQLFGYKAAYEAFILIKDLEWSKRLEKYVALLPELQKQLPVEPKYKAEKPGSDADLNAYGAVYYAGDCNAGSKTIAINLPNDEEVQLKKGSRKLQLKNSMRAKFDKIVVPISELMIAEEQLKHIKFNAFFGNTMFHEVAHGLGIKNVIGKKVAVRQALQEQYSAIEEGKADILGLYLVTKLYEMGELTEGEIMDNYVTFCCGIFRSSRFGAASAHGKANMTLFNFFLEKGAIAKQDDGRYFVNKEKLQQAMNLHIQKLLGLQGDGNYDGAKKLISEKGVVSDVLQADLDKINAAGIPVDIVFEQGKSVLFGEK